MKLIDSLVVLATVLISILFFSARTRTTWSMRERVRRALGARMLVQAAVALWVSVLILVDGTFVLNGQFQLRVSPTLMLVGTIILLALGCYWIFRGRMLLKSRRVFSNR
jgi:hypothetical protein